MRQSLLEERSMVDNDEKASLRQSIEGPSSGSRLESDRGVDDSVNNQVNAIVNTLQQMEDGELGSVVGVRDRPFAAYLATLDDAEFEAERSELGSSLVQELGRDPESYDDFAKSDLIRLMYEVALKTADPDAYALIEHAWKQHKESKESGRTGFQ